MVPTEKTFEAMLTAPPPPVKPRPNGTWTGLGWDTAVRTKTGYGFYKDGSWIGMKTFMKRSPDGICWALLFNASMEMDADDSKAVADALKRVWEKIEGFKKFPAIDLFDEFK